MLYLSTWSLLVGANKDWLLCLSWQGLYLSDGDLYFEQSEKNGYMVGGEKMADIINFPNMVARGVQSWGSQGVKKALDEVTGTAPRSRGRPREWIKIPYAVIEGHPLEGYFLAAQQGIRPPAVVPTAEGLGDIRLASLPQTIQKQNGFLNNINWNWVLLIVGVGFLLWFAKSGRKSEPARTTPAISMSGYGCVMSDGRKVCGELV